MKNIMKRNISKGLALGFAAGSLVLAACGGDNGSSSKEPGYDDDTVATFKDLPACDSKIEGWIYYVTDEDAEYACGNGKWDLFDDIWGDKSSSSSPVAGSSSEGQSSSSEVASSSSVLSSSSSSVVEYSSCEEAVSSSSVAAQSSSSGAVSPSSSSEAESSSSAVSSSSSEGVESSSSEVSETVVSCDMVMKINGMHTCGEMPANIPQAAEFKASCNVSAEEALFVTSTLGTGCPSGYVLKCSDAGGSLYSYNQEDKGKTCEQYLAEQEEDDDEESSSSVASSSSIVSSSSSVKGTSDIDDSSVYDPSTNTLTDNRDGHTYKTVTIGTQTWMAENLNYEYNEGTAKSYCYNDKADSCAKYGRLYTWAAAMDSAAQFSTAGKGCGYGKTCSPSGTVRGVCPQGWHLPNDTEWNTLWTAVGGTSTAGTKLKTTSGWYNGGNGNDSYGFSVLPAGYRYYGGNYSNAGNLAYFWSSSESSSNYAYSWYFYYGDGRVDRNSNFKGNGFSVRCLKD